MDADADWTWHFRGQVADTDWMWARSDHERGCGLDTGDSRSWTGRGLDMDNLWSRLRTDHGHAQQAGQSRRFIRDQAVTTSRTTQP
jgi:hypothetical protein